MALNRHDPEWQRVIATAALAGVTFKKVQPERSKRAHLSDFPTWWAMMPNNHGNVHGYSKFEAAQRALQIMEGRDV